MRLRPGVFLLCVFGAALAGCGGGGGAAKGGTSLLPPAAGGGGQQTAKNHATFVVSVPRSTSAQSGTSRPAYVSPATQSMTIAVFKGTTSVISETVGLTASSSGCTSSLANITCTLTLNLNAGSYTASITTYDGTNGTGNQLSTAQNIAFTVAANQNNLVPLSLSGIPTNIIAMAGKTANSVYVIAEDADGNFIVGSGAPTFTASKASGSAVAAITQPTSTAPNTISFSQASPAVYGNETIAVTASYPSGQTNACSEAGAVCTLATPISVSYGNIAFVANYDDSNLLGFTLPLSGSSQSPAYTITVGSYPYGLVGVNPTNGDVFSAGYESPYDFVSIAPPYTSPVTNSLTGNDFDYPEGSIAAAPNGDVFVANYDNDSVAMFTAPYTSAATQITSGVYYPLAAAADANNNVYIANDESTGGITAFASPYSSPFATVNTTSIPYSLAISGSTLVVGEANSIDVFSLPLSNGATPIATFTNDDVYGVAFDPSGNIWAACEYSCPGGYSDGAVYEYPKSFSNGESPSVSLQMPTGGSYSSYYPNALGFDASGNLYVLNEEGGSYDGGLLEYSGTITSSSTPAAGTETSAFYEPWGMAIAPPQLVVTP